LNQKEIDMNRFFRKFTYSFFCVVIISLLINFFYTVSCATLKTIPIYSYKIIQSYPHDPQAFTQGLVFQDGFLYEGTGLYQFSSLRKIDLETGNILQIRENLDQYFGEGITIFENKIIQLTWRSKIGFVYDKNTFNLLQKFHYPYEGWGITHDGKRLLISDGTSTIHFLDPDTFKETGKIEVHENDTPVTRINELEYIKGEIYANIWQTDLIAIINPLNGSITGWIDLKGILSDRDFIEGIDVLNGIAHDEIRDRLFVTGKFWPHIFEIKLIKIKTPENTR